MKSIWSYPAYRRRGGLFGSSHSVNDVAILELTNPVEMNRYAGPVCLPQDDTALSDHCFITGWGRDEDGKAIVKTNIAFSQINISDGCNVVPVQCLK